MRLRPTELATRFVTVKPKRGSLEPSSRAAICSLKAREERESPLAAPFADLEAQMAQAFRRLSRDRTKTHQDQASKEP